MNAFETSRTIFRWALKRGYGWDVRSQPEDGMMRVEVRLRHAVVCLEDGRLTEVLARGDGRFTDALIRELASVFALCGYIEICRDGSLAALRRERTTGPAISRRRAPSGTLDAA